jgi:hypothetical protein
MFRITNAHRVALLYVVILGNRDTQIAARGVPPSRDCRGCRRILGGLCGNAATQDIRQGWPD